MAIRAELMGLRRLHTKGNVAPHGAQERDSMELWEFYVSSSHDEFLEINFEDGDELKLEVIRSGQNRPTDSNTLSFKTDADRFKAIRDLPAWNEGIRWYRYKKGRPLSNQVFRVRFYGQLTEDWEYDVDEGRAAAKSQADIEFYDFTILDRSTGEYDGFSTEVSTKKRTNDEGVAFLEATVTGRWWSPYFEVDAICPDEAQATFLEREGPRFVIEAAWDDSAVVEFETTQGQVLDEDWSAYWE
jgi:hypothetical protein